MILTSTVRRSVAIPRSLINEVTSLAPKELKGNFNRLVITALHGFVKEQRARQFRQEMATMARDPEVRSECAAISRAFSAADGDGLEVS